jgi:hypothetical protein
MSVKDCKRHKFRPIFLRQRNLAYRHRNAPTDIDEHDAYHESRQITCACPITARFYKVRMTSCLHNLPSLTLGNQCALHRPADRRALHAKDLRVLGDPSLLVSFRFVPSG